MENEEVIDALVGALEAAPKWYYCAETVDRKKLEKFMEEYCIWHNTIRERALSKTKGQSEQR